MSTYRCPSCGGTPDGTGEMACHCLELAGSNATPIKEGDKFTTPGGHKVEVGSNIVKVTVNPNVKVTVNPNMAPDAWALVDSKTGKGVYSDGKGEPTDKGYREGEDGVKGIARANRKKAQEDLP